MSNGQYAAALSLFFVSYSIFEPLTNVLLKRFSPKLFLTITMCLWGLCMTLMGFSYNFSGLTAARWFLGLTEAGLFPGINFYLSCWYKRKELGVRAAIFFSAAALAGSFGGLLAAAIALMDGIGHLHGWQWIFILEGLATVVIGGITYFVVQDFPDKATFLTPIEKARVIKRLKEDNQSSASHEDVSRHSWKAAYTDWKTYAFAIVYMGADGALYSFSLFVPTIIRSLANKPTPTRANLLSVPPYACAFVLTVLVGYLADRTGRRGIYNIGCACFGIAGFSMLIGSANSSVQYAGVFLGALGIYPCIANTIVWCSSNIEGVYKRGIVVGTVIGWGNLNGVVSSNIYRAQDAPRYYLGHGVVLGYEAVFLFGGSIITWLLLARENRLRRAGRRDHWVENKTEDEIRALGDNVPTFFYHY